MNAFWFALPSLAWLSSLGGEAPPPITLPVRIHLMTSGTEAAMHTTLAEADIRRIFAKVNIVWAPAGIRFEIESIEPTPALPLAPALRLKSEFERVASMIPTPAPHSQAIDICYVKQLTPNGFYNGERIVVKDTAVLKEVPGGLDEPLPRVTSHEIGHALGLAHRQDTTNLMQSGTTGFSLNDGEIAAARAQALERSRQPAATGTPSPRPGDPNAAPASASAPLNPLEVKPPIQP